ncbi:helix-turn-helix domain-containing protein [Desulfovibrio aminophilus]|uniref:helix-turn-helix domain-containing protein n=1 Tax=Desulfovibrio aminophilus TaxID=81425 RepID=UPI0033949EBF
MSEHDPILATWSHTAREAHSFLVMPDGCRDFILRCRPGTRPILYVSPLMATPEQVSVIPGERFIGVRLQPGARIDHSLQCALQRPESLEELADFAREAARIPPDVAEALSCLALAESPAAAARDLGVSLRTLQRHTLKATGQPPDFWRRLARARKAARGVLSGASLMETAHACLFADQAHMTRELRRWFSMTPGELAAERADRNHSAWSIHDLGYDAPATGEQISIK